MGRFRDTQKNGKPICLMRHPLSRPGGDAFWPGGTPMPNPNQFPCLYIQKYGCVRCCVLSFVLAACVHFESKIVSRLGFGSDGASFCYRRMLPFGATHPTMQITNTHTLIFRHCLDEKFSLAKLDGSRRGWKVKLSKWTQIGICHCPSPIGLGTLRNGCARSAASFRSKEAHVLLLQQQSSKQQPEVGLLWCFVSCGRQADWSLFRKGRHSRNLSSVL